MTAAPADVRVAYQHCEQVTSAQARNFSYGIRLLPGAKRRALSAVYAFARRIDDIGDGALPAADKLTALAQARALVADLAGGGRPPADDLVLVALADASGRFALPLGAFGELIDGCEADVRGTTYRTFAELEHYCRCVAGSIGRLSLGVFGASDPAAAAPLADALGVALQLTNIIRDVHEDLGNGRIYLPAEDLARFGCTLSATGAAGPAGVAGPAGDAGLAGETGLAGDAGLARDAGLAGDAGLARDAGLASDGKLAGNGGGLVMDAGPAGEAGLVRLVRFEADRAIGWYATGMRLMPLLDRRSAASAGAMAGIYLRLLEQIAAAPAAALRQRQSLPARAKMLVAGRCLAGMAPRRPRRSWADDAAAEPQPMSPPGAQL